MCGGWLAIPDCRPTAAILWQLDSKLQKQVNLELCRKINCRANIHVECGRACVIRVIHTATRLIGSREAVTSAYLSMHQYSQVSQRSLSSPPQTAVRREGVTCRQFPGSPRCRQRPRLVSSHLSLCLLLQSPTLVPRRFPPRGPTAQRRRTLRSRALPGRCSTYRLAASRPARRTRHRSPRWVRCRLIRRSGVHRAPRLGKTRLR